MVYGISQKRKLNNVWIIDESSDFTLLCVVVSNELVAFTGLTGKTEINGRKLGTKLAAYAQMF